LYKNAYGECRIQIAQTIKLIWIISWKNQNNNNVAYLDIAYI